MTSSDNTKAAKLNGNLFRIFHVHSFYCGVLSKRKNVRLDKPYQLILPAPEGVDDVHLSHAVRDKLTADLLTHLESAVRDYLQHPQIPSSVKDFESTKSALRGYIKSIIAASEDTNIGAGIIDVCASLVYESVEKDGNPNITLKDLPGHLGLSRSQFLSAKQVLDKILDVCGADIELIAKSQPDAPKACVVEKESVSSYVHGAAQIHLRGHDVSYYFTKIENDRDDGENKEEKLKAFLKASLQQFFIRRMKNWAACGISSDFDIDVRSAYLRQAATAESIATDIFKDRITVDIVMSIGGKYNRTMSKAEYSSFHASLSNMYRRETEKSVDKLITTIMTEEGTIQASGLYH